MLADQPVTATVLMVDDDPEFAEDVQAILGAATQITHVRGTAEAAAELLRWRPDLLWLDLDLEAFYGDNRSTEGLTFLKVVRARLAPELPAIIVASCVDEEVAQRARALGVRLCLRKPPDLARVLELVTELVAARKH